MKIRQALWRPTHSRPIDAGHADGDPSAGRRHRWARTYRDSELVCASVTLTESGLRTELAELVDRRGAIARRAAERMPPVHIVVADPSLGRQRIIGSVQPPQLRYGDLHDVEFGLREMTQ
jgi:hypothetical protein